MQSNNTRLDRQTDRQIGAGYLVFTSAVLTAISTEIAADQRDYYISIMQ